MVMDGDNGDAVADPRGGGGAGGPAPPPPPPLRKKIMQKHVIFIFFGGWGCKFLNFRGPTKKCAHYPPPPPPPTERLFGRRDFQIFGSKKKRKVGPLPLRNPGSAPVMMMMMIKMMIKMKMKMKYADVNESETENLYKYTRVIIYSDEQCF